MSIAYFPTELLKLIAVELCDKDLCNFSLTCRAFHGAVQGDQIVWRSLYLKVYDEPAKQQHPYDWRKTYQTRQRLLQRELRNIEFQAGNSDKEVEALEVLQGLLLDARGRPASDAQSITGTNFEHIVAAKPPPSLFFSCLHDSPNPLLQEISLFLTPIFKLPDIQNLFKLQSIVYNPNNDPAIVAGAPNLRTLEALAQFFTYHTHSSSESLVFHQKTLLQPYELPAFWEGNIWDGSPNKIPTKWFGAYTYLSHHGVVRRMLHGNHEFSQDRSDSHLVDMTLSFTLPSSPSSDPKFTGSGRDFRTFTVDSGRITLLDPPPEVRAIKGWKRVRFVKDYQSHRWMYEGVMLPGNNMILGHWKYSMDEIIFPEQSGPFVFWAAPEGSSLEFRDNRLSFPI